MKQNVVQLKAAKHKASRPLGLLLAVLTGVLLLVSTALAAEQVTYMSSTDGKTWSEQTASAEPLTGSETVLGAAGSQTWYAANGALTYGSAQSNARLTVQGDVSLILKNGCELTVWGGIKVPEGSSLSIYAQPADPNAASGKLTAYAVAGGLGRYDAAIGGDSGEKAGTIRIYGGQIAANPDDDWVQTTGAGIGSGDGDGTENAFAGVYIYGGNIIAQSSTGAGVGGCGGSVRIFGGRVKGKSISGTGVGGSANGAGDIEISGGYVHGESQHSAGIGSGYHSDGSGSLKISGGQVHGYSSYYGTGLGVRLEDSSTATNTFRAEFSLSDRNKDYIKAEANTGWESTNKGLSVGSLTLNGLYLDGQQATESAVKEKSNLTLTLEPYTISYDMGQVGRSMGLTAPASQPTTWYIDYSDPTKAGWQLGSALNESLKSNNDLYAAGYGWFLDAACTQLASDYDNNNDHLFRSGDLTLYAHWFGPYSNIIDKLILTTGLPQAGAPIPDVYHRSYDPNYPDDGDLDDYGVTISEPTAGVYVQTARWVTPTAQGATFEAGKQYHLWLTLVTEGHPQNSDTPMFKGHATVQYDPYTWTISNPQVCYELTINGVQDNSLIDEVSVGRTIVGFTYTVPDPNTEYNISVTGGKAYKYDTNTGSIDVKPENVITKATAGTAVVALPDAKAGQYVTQWTATPTVSSSAFASEEFMALLQMPAFDVTLTPAYGQQQEYACDLSNGDKEIPDTLFAALLLAFGKPSDVGYNVETELDLDGDGKNDVVLWQVEGTGGAADTSWVRALSGASHSGEYSLTTPNVSQYWPVKFTFPAQVQTYPIFVQGVRVTETNKDDILGDAAQNNGVASVKYTPATATELAKLTLTNANIEAKDVPVAPPGVAAAGVYHMENLTLELVGASSITGKGATGTSHGIIGSENGKYDLTVTGEGSLTVTAGEAGSNRSCGLEVGSLTMDGGTLIASGGKGPLSYGIVAKDGITVSGGTVEAYGDSYGIGANNVSSPVVHTISGGTVEARGETLAFQDAPDLSGYTPAPYVLVNTETRSESAQPWNDSDPLGGSNSSFKYVKIAPGAAQTTHTVTYKIVNGTWDDGTVQKTVTYSDGDTILGWTIPRPQPNQGFGVGKWDVEPVGQSVDGDKTFTWSYFHYKIDYNTQGKGTPPAPTESINSGSSGSGSSNVEWYGNAAEVPMQSGDDLYRVYDAQGRIWFTDPDDDSTAVESGTPISADTTLYCKWVQGDKIVDAVSLSVFPQAGDPIPQNHWYTGGGWGELSAQFVRANGTDYEIGAVNWDPDGDTTFVQGKTYEVRVQVSTGDMESSRTFLKGHATVTTDSNGVITNPEDCYELTVNGVQDNSLIDYVQPTESFVTIQYTVPAAGKVEIDPESYDFGTAQHGYDPISPRPLTLRNGTSRSVTVKPLGGLTAFAATPLNAAAQPLSLPYTLSAGESMNIAVNPQSGLAAGTHSETLTIAYNDGGDKSLTAALSFVVTGGQTPASHTVTVKADPAAGGTVTGGGTVTAGQSTTITATANSGYVFDGWYKGTTLLSPAATCIYKPSGDVTLTAKFIRVISFVTVPVTAPVKGATPQSTIPETVLYTGTISWTPNDSTFAADTEYTAVVELTAKDGYVFASNATATVDGADTVDGRVASDGSGMKIIATFPKTADKTPADIFVNNSDITLPYGDTYTIVVTTDPAGLDMEFIPNGDGVVSVDENGVVTALKLGVTTVTVRCNDGIYFGETTVTVRVVTRPITEAFFTLPTETKVYNGIPQTQAVASSTLREGTDYEVEYAANTDVGTASYTVKGKGNYTGTINRSFSIEPLDASDFMVIIEPNTVEYNGKPWTVVAGIADLNENKISAAVAKSASTRPLDPQTDFTLSWSDSTDAGTVTVTATMKGNYKGSATGTFLIEPAQVTITVDSASKKFGAADPVFTGTVTGLVDPGDLGTVSYTRPGAGTDEAAGSYPEALGATYTANKNYVVTVKKGDFTIEPGNVYTVTVSNDGNGTGTANPTSGTTGTKVTLTANPNPGYKFKEWQVVNANDGTIDSATANPAEFTIGTGDAVIKAVFEPIGYQLWLGGTQVTDQNKDDILNDGGKAKYDPATGTLTLDSPSITTLNSESAVIFCSEPGPLTITGKATLNVTGAEYGLRYQGAGELTVKGDISATGVNGGIYAPNANINISGGQVKAEATFAASSTNPGGCTALYTEGKLTVSGGALTANAIKGGQNVGVYAQGGLEISGGELTAQGDQYGISVGENADITFANGTQAVWALGNGGAVTMGRGQISIGDRLSLQLPNDPRYHSIAGVKLNNAKNQVLDGSDRPAKLVNILPITYTVTYAAGEGATGTAPVDANSPYVGGSKVTLLDQGQLSKANHTFAGWKDQDGKNYAAGAEFNISKNMTLTAQWQEKAKFTVTYAVEGGSFPQGTVTTEQVYEGGNPANVPSGMTPDSTHKNTGSWYQGSTKLTGSPAALAVSSDVTFTYKFDAKAQPGSYTITFDANGGSVTPARATTGSDGKLTNIPTPTRSGSYDFTGWFTATTGGTQVTTDTVFTEPATVYARWVRHTAPPTTYYTLSYQSNGGSAVASGRYSKDSVVTLSARPVREGYSFTGWYADSALNRRVTSVTMDADKTVYAGWQENGTPPDHDHDCPSKHLRDVDENAWYHEYVDYVVEKGLMQGIADDLFGVEVTTSRAMIVTILYRLEGRPAVSGASPFDDVASGQWYTDAIIWANQKGIVEGYGNGKFGPGDLITREQFAAIMYRYANFKGYDTGKAADLSGYTDAADISDWALTAMQWANAEELITGRTATTLVPRGEATRAEAAAILMRFIEKIM